MDPKAIRNIGVFGHAGSGKTTLLDGILFLLKENTRIGRVDEGNSLFDFDPEEIKRKISINLSVYSLAKYKDKLINFVDTPGYLDFAGEVLAAVKIIDTGIIVVDATAGVEVGTELVWRYLEEESKPTIIFLTKFKKENADFDTVYSQITRAFGYKIFPITIPLQQGPSMQGYINLIDRKAYGYEKGERKEVEIPDALKEKVEEFRGKAIEAICEEDDALMEKYLEGKEIKIEEFLPSLGKALTKRKIFPLFCGDGYELIGVDALLDFCANYSPSPLDIEEIKGQDPIKKEPKVLKPDPKGQPLAFVFKTISDPHVGDLLNIRVFSGEIETGTSLYNSKKGTEEKITQLFIMQGQRREEVKKLSCGMLGILSKLKNTSTDDTLSSRDNPIELTPIPFPEPTVSIAVVPKSKEDEEKISAALAKLRKEDFTFNHYYNPEFRQTVISGVGEMHLDVIFSKLRRRYGVSVDVEPPKIAYRETIKRKAEAQGKYKKQTGGRGQYGDVWLRLEPLKRGEGFKFESTIFGGAIPSKYFPSVEKGIKEAAQKGTLAGFPVIDFKATLYDGSYHPVDSSDIAFKIAGSMAFKNCAKNAEPTLLEPILEVEVYVPEEFMGDVLGDLNSRRAKIQGMEPSKRYQVIKATVPEAEMYKYAINLRTITQGKGVFKAKFSHYEEVPFEIAQKIIQSTKAETL